MKLFLYGILAGLMCLGLYTMYDATMKEREATAAAAAETTAQLAEQRRCEDAKNIMFSQFDKITEQNKFPSREQQDYWREIMRGCEE